RGAPQVIVTRSSSDPRCASPTDEEHQCQHQSDDEQDPGNVRGDSGYTREAQHACDQCDDQEDQCVIQHVQILLPSYFTTVLPGPLYPWERYTNASSRSISVSIGSSMIFRGLLGRGLSSGFGSGSRLG